MKEEQAAHEKLIAMLDETFSVITSVQGLKRMRNYFEKKKWRE